jgi:hypothetical protein
MLLFEGRHFKKHSFTKFLILEKCHAKLVCAFFWRACVGQFLYSQTAFLLGDKIKQNPVLLIQRIFVGNKCTKVARF